MIRRAQNLDPLPTDPTPEEIRRRTKAIRKTWTPRERFRRSSFRRIGWLPPIFAEADIVLGFGPTDYEPR
jgi:hypothetical protein